MCLEDSDTKIECIECKEKYPDMNKLCCEHAMDKYNSVGVSKQ